MPAQQTEAQFQSAVIDYARRTGWRVAHFHDSRREVAGKLVGDVDAVGFPDLTLARDGRIIFAELKAEKGRLRTEQRDWLAELNGIGELGLEDGITTAFIRLQGRLPRVLVFLWRPSDWPEIEAVLR